MTTSPPFQVHSEARGPHWIAWLTLADALKPYRSVVLVGASQKEAEARARLWGEQNPYLIP